MNTVMIAGNGISRLAHAQDIAEYDGEVWACNRAYLDIGERIARLTGHPDVLREAAKYRGDHDLSFEIWTDPAQKIPGAKRLTVPDMWHRDSGTTLVAQALHEGHNVLCVGFDLGGPDIHSPNHEAVIKDEWIYRWREIFDEWGAGRIKWVGHNHTPFILSGKHPRKYSARYVSGESHIDDPEYRTVFEQFTGRSADKPQEIKRKFKVQFLRGKGIGLYSIASEKVAHAMERRGEVKIVMEVTNEQAS